MTVHVLSCLKYFMLLGHEIHGLSRHARCACGPRNDLNYYHFPSVEIAPFKGNYSTKAL